jgi:hypothetical protein
VENIPWSVCEEQPCAVGIWGRGLVPRDLWGSLSVGEAFHLKLQHRLVLELLMDSFTGSKTYTIDFLLANAHRQLKAFTNAIFPIISTKLRNPRSTGYTQQTCSQAEGLAMVFVTHWKTTARSERGV